MPQPFPICFKNVELARGGIKQLGVGPSWQGKIPLVSPRFSIEGIAKGVDGAALGGATVDLYLSATKVLVDSVVADAQGRFIFRTPSAAQFYFIVVYKAGTPDVFGTTANTITGA